MIISTYNWETTKINDPTLVPCYCSLYRWHSQAFSFPRLSCNEGLPYKVLWTMACEERFQEVRKLPEKLFFFGIKGQWVMRPMWNLSLLTALNDNFLSRSEVSISRPWTKSKENDSRVKPYLSKPKTVSVTTHPCSPCHVRKANFDLFIELALLSLAFSSVIWRRKI